MRRGSPLEEVKKIIEKCQSSARDVPRDPPPPTEEEQRRAEAGGMPAGHAVVPRAYRIAKKKAEAFDQIAKLLGL